MHVFGVHIISSKFMKLESKVRVDTSLLCI